MTLYNGSDRAFIALTAPWEHVLRKEITQHTFRRKSSGTEDRLFALFEVP
jgi:hypothetical protein